MKWLEKLSYIGSSLGITLFIIAVITFLWQQLELVYLGYVNDNPIDAIITILYSYFVYSYVYRRLGE